jgi:hypothetical protein
MSYSTIRIEGAILSADILDRLEPGELGGQAPADFGFTGNKKVKDEILSAWADAQAMWRVFIRQREKLTGNVSGTSETRRYWIVPLLGLLGYTLEVSRQGELVNGRNYAISHRSEEMDNFAVHIMGCNDSLDKKREDSGPRMSPHALVQEYLNVTEHLYAIVTNGLQLRLLRDSSRLVKLSFIEFDLQAMMDEEHFADFAIMYRLLHASRMPKKSDGGAESLIEKYHQDALESGSRIREGLSGAVEHTIIALANGMLSHPSNNDLRELIENKKYSAESMYLHLLRIIYRLLFLMVIEERKLIFPKGTDPRKVTIYYDYYSLLRLRKLCEKQYIAMQGYCDYWIALRNTFRLFEHARNGEKLNIPPLAGDLFGPDSIGILVECNLDNTVLVECLRNLSLFTNKSTGQKMRVNYASLNVEEFGSVYEGLLEYAAEFSVVNGQQRFGFVKGDERSKSGAHYTPEELVQPLIKHSLEYIIEDKLKESDKEKALLSITVCDIACGSGHILLSAARRIAIEVARVRTGEDQPAPNAIRKATRDVIRQCIYGVDKNPLAVELCKVGLWLEAHNPGEPLNFLDHHIKCGDSIVGLVNKEELENGIADEAFKRLPDDDTEICGELRKRNKKEREEKLTKIDFESTIGTPLFDIGKAFNDFDRLPEETPEEVEGKKNKYKELMSGPAWHRLKVLSDIQISQFFIAKNEQTVGKNITDGQFRSYLSGLQQPIGQAVGTAMSEAASRRFFHWFLEFPEIFQSGGFDCILGNPPFLGNRSLRGAFGIKYLNYLTNAYAPAGAIDLVGYFFRRVFTVLGKNGFQALISTNTIAQGGTREGSLEVIASHGGMINFAMRSVRWPGIAAVNVSLIAVHKGAWQRSAFLDGKVTSFISTYLDDAKTIGKPCPLKANDSKSFQGSIVLGKGFVLEPEEAQALLEKDKKNEDVIFPYLNGEDLNSRPDQSPSRWVINFFDWPIEKAMEYEDCFRIIEERVKPERTRIDEKGVSVLRKPLPQKWWIYGDKRPELYRKIAEMDRVLVITRVSKYVAVTFAKLPVVFMDKVIVLPFENTFYFSLFSSNIYDHWAWKYSSTLGAGTVNISPTDCFETFPFPVSKNETTLTKIGEKYYLLRSSIMMFLSLGLTKIYNLFHDSNLTIGTIEKLSKCSTPICKQAFADILKLRSLHKEMDLAVLSAYGWTDIDLRHDFYEVDYLPENDRIRYTIHPDDRREVLKRLLQLNHERHEEEVRNGLWDKKKSAGKKKEKVEKKPATFAEGKQMELPIYAPGEAVQGDLFEGV